MAEVIGTFTAGTSPCGNDYDSLSSMSQKQLEQGTIPNRGWLTTVTTIASGVPTPLPPQSLNFRKRWMLQNTSASTIALGGNSVTMANGVFVNPATQWPVQGNDLEMGPLCICFGIGPAPSGVVVLERS